MSTVRDAIFAATPDPDVRRAMLLGALLEGGSLGAGPFPPGDQGTSFGPFQIHLPAHPGVTSSQASDPDFAVRFMLPAYQSGVQRAGGAGSADQAARAAYYAERPKNMYPASRYTSLWQQVTAALTGAPVGTGTLASDTTGGSSSPFAFLQPVADFFHALAWLVNPLNWLRIVLALFGVGFTLGGITAFVTAV
ncbi:hypothetical protein [Amycolatopsis alkalitolerans]|uniref:Uncharacterized protein n=1 Tax=Amycolatopsis alkalitolerans TaxID=2547244 RepID=A0A5C4LS28_9PSEU|nr:hypothetical protein [Amycolatopsis alkalitolerans]TNC19058.1 hypothetical protein FG385_32855 [Amycolatopsis alkalitolerans]